MLCESGGWCRKAKASKSRQLAWWDSNSLSRERNLVSIFSIGYNQILTWLERMGNEWMNERMADWPCATITKANSNTWIEGCQLLPCIAKFKTPHYLMATSGGVGNDKCLEDSSGAVKEEVKWGLPIVVIHSILCYYYYYIHVPPSPNCSLLLSPVYAVIYYSMRKQEEIK